MRYLLSLIFVLAGLIAFGQKDVLIFGDTDKTSFDPDYTSKDKHEGKKELLLIRKKSKKVLDGNKCFKDYQVSIGVRVKTLIKGEPPYYNGISKFMTNTGTRIRGTFRLGPFWVIRLNKRMRQCRDSLHDFIG